MIKSSFGEKFECVEKMSGEVGKMNVYSSFSKFEEKRGREIGPKVKRTFVNERSYSVFVC